MKQKQIISLLKKLETFLYRKADHIVCLTESFKRHIVKRGVNPEHISVITNAADLQTFRRLSKKNPIRKALELNGKFVASYIGTHGMAHALETVLEAADLLSTEKNIVFMLVGDGAERNRLIEQKKALGLKNVLMLPQQHRDKMPEFLAASDVCMVLLKKDNLFKTVIPSKMFEPMAMERPLILGVEGESKAIVERGKCGLCIEPENHKHLAKAVLRLYNNKEFALRLGRNGRKYVEKNFDRDKLAKTYLGILEQIIPSQTTSLL